MAEYGGKLPGNAKDMQANIPGIGRYSAGAICSIAYNEQVPVVRLCAKSVTQTVLLMNFVVGWQCSSASQSPFSVALSSESQIHSRYLMDGCDSNGGDRM